MNSKYDWTEIDPLLGKKSDGEISKEYGIPRGSVTYRRQKLGIKPNHNKNGKYLTADRSSIVKYIWSTSRSGQKRKVIHYEPIPDLHTGHPLFEKARTIARKYIAPDNRILYKTTHYEEAVSTVVLALLCGDEPEDAVKEYLKRERKNSYMTKSLTFEMVEELSA